jgi:tetratricopeptide (TPR) repeat protein
LANLIATCPNCGEKIPPSVGECMYCPPSLSAPGRPGAVSPNPFSPPPSTAEPTAAQLLLVAEECLVRSQPEKAAELATRALAVRPESLEAKGTLARARRQLARQRRRGRQEQRLKEAQALLDAGDAAGAEKLVASVLKRVPGQPEALALFGRLKGRRPAAGDAEAEAERELARLAQGQAQRAAEAARVARHAGWDRKALLALRRGLRLVPDDPALIALLRETEHALGDQDRAGARRRAGNAQVREALESLKAGRLEDSLKSLRSLLRQDPDHARAQAAVQEVRREWLARQPAPAPASPRPAPRAVPAPIVAPAPVAKPAPPRPPAPNVVHAPPATATRLRPPAAAAAIPHAPRPPETVRRPPTLVAAAPPPEIARRPSRKGTPLLLVLGSAALMIGLLVALTSRPSGAPARTTQAAVAPVSTVPPAPSGTPPPTGPLAAADPDVRQAVEATLAAYARALEAQDAALLAQARPDLTAAERERLLAPFRGAVNVATDLRVLDVIPSRGLMVVPVLRTDVIVGGRAAPTAPVEETLRFERRDGAWRLAAGSAR